MSFNTRYCVLGVQNKNILGEHTGPKREKFDGTLNRKSKKLAVFNVFLFSKKTHQTLGRNGSKSKTFKRPENLTLWLNWPQLTSISRGISSQKTESSI